MHQCIDINSNVANSFEFGLGKNSVFGRVSGSVLAIIAMDWVPEILFSGNQNQPKNRFKPN